MTTDLELTELFNRKAEDMQLTGGIPDALTKRIKRRQGLLGMAAVTVVAALALGAWGFSDEFSSDDALPPARDVPVVEERPLTVVDLNGTWLLVENTRWPGLLVQFSTDGMFAIDDRGILATSPAARGTFELDGDTITFTSEGSDICINGDSWEWKASLTATGRLDIVHTEEAADPCRNPNGTEWTLVRVSPPPSAAILGIEIPDSPEGRPPTPGELAGIWFPVEAPGILFSFTPAGAFAVDNHGLLVTNPAIRGTHELEDGRISFTIEGGDACAFGDSWVWRARLSEDGLLRIKHTKEASGNCRTPRGTEWTLIRLSPGSPASAEITAD